MSQIATYTFLPWLRQGLANQIDGQVGSRATIPVVITIKGKKVEGIGELTAPVNKSIEIYGPGDIIGIDKRAIIKEEPHNWITNFEPNYLPYIEFYDEDFPWRYTPLPNPNNHRLKPWLVLVVLEEEEYENGQNIKDKPLPFIKVKDSKMLPDLEQSWAWAHVQVNESLVSETEIIEGTETPKIRFDNNGRFIAAELEKVIRSNPDLAYSRIFCPRRLKANVAYHAFLVPAFESGRLAGLGQNPESATFNQKAWDNTVAAAVELPFYHNWYFRTGNVGDFEYLVRLLEPKPIDSRVGTRDMDVQRPGANLKGLQEADLQGVLKLGGALRIPASSQKDKAEAEKYEYWAFRGDKTPEEIAAIADKNNAVEQPLQIENLHPLQSNIARFINLTDKYQEKFAVSVEDERIIEIHSSSGIEQEIDATPGTSEFDITNNPDPLITAPLYGQWHALTQRLVEERDDTEINPNYNWIHELNLDPRWRVSAGFGTKVVQENQENYMKAAWEQIGEVLEANKRIREAQLAKLSAEIWYKKHLSSIQSKSESQWLQVSSPIHTRVLSSVKLEDGTERPLSVFYQKKESKLTTAATSVMMRKVMRPRGKFVKKRLKFTAEYTADNLITRMNAGEVSAAPPRTPPKGIQTPQNLVDAALPDNAPKFLLEWLKRFPWLRWIPLGIAILLLLFLLFFRPAVAIVSVVSALAVFMIYLFLWLSQLLRQMQGADRILEGNQSPESVNGLPNSTDFRITSPNEAFSPNFSQGEDSAELQRFKAALKDANLVLQESRRIGTVKPRPALDITAVNKAVFEKIDPSVTIPNWVISGLYLPPFIKAQQKETFKEAEAYPVFDLPMYKPLAEYSAELFLPNINYIEQNSISLLETNQKFIEAYLVGLNHEFARELLWREYPTDQRGSYFRQFWETNGLMDVTPVTRDTLEARYKKVFETKKLYIPELVEYKEKLENRAINLDDAFLIEAHQHIFKEELKDIKPIHYWSKNARLGEHDYRELPGENEEEAVLVIRGELLKKYPTAVIYAHRAAWQDKDRKPVLNSSQTIDNTKERTLYPLTADQEANPPRNIVKTPLYEAKVDPDIYFFGFDLTIPEAMGADGSNPTDDPGWFFIIKERPGEPRLGLDIGNGGNIDEANKIELWNDLNWGDVKPAVPEGAYLQISSDTPTVSADQTLEDDDDEKIVQQREDRQISWHRDMNAAELAYILYQVPVLVAVHASEMLPD